jgi:hypothetical protein
MLSVRGKTVRLASFSEATRKAESPRAAKNQRIFTKVERTFSVPIAL